VEEAATLVGDVSAELSAYLGLLDADPARLEVIYERRAALRALTRSMPMTSRASSPGPSTPAPGWPRWTRPTKLLEELDKERLRLAGAVGELAVRLTAARLEGRGVRPAGQRRAGRARHAAIPGSRWPSSPGRPAATSRR